MATPTLTKARTISSVLLELFSDKLAYGFSTKGKTLAGTNADADTLNANRQFWLEQFGMSTDLDALSFPTQVHENRFFKTSEARHNEVDAILVDTPNTPAVVFSADCTPVILYAPDIHQGAVVHCGWKSTTKRLAQTMVNTLVGQGATVDQLIAVIGPALSIDGFEIDSPVLEMLELSSNSHHRELWMRKSPSNPAKFHADIPFINELQLREVGVRRIERIALATDTHRDLFWSHRAGDAERQGTFLELK
jgi:YfiH family protein